MSISRDGVVDAYRDGNWRSLLSPIPGDKALESGLCDILVCAHAACHDGAGQMLYCYTVSYHDAVC